MTDWISREPRTAQTGSQSTPRTADDSERSVARAVALGLPIASVGGAIAAGIGAGAGSALLVLASGALLATVALLWTSLRTLSGDAPLPSGLEGRTVRRRPATELSERKRRVLRALKDLEGEHALGKIDDADYESVAAQYREDAKALMRELDLQTGPARAEAERLASEYVTRHAARDLPAGSVAVPGAETRERIACGGCGASNEDDAAFCKRCGSTLEKASR